MRPLPTLRRKPGPGCGGIHAGATGYRLLPAKDRSNGRHYDGSLIYPPDSTLRG
ncbi:MAG TPA: hypothetical protein VIJ04_18050 [Xanthobacteraceae bacterium]